MSEPEETVTTWYLETTSPDQLKPKPPVTGFTIEEATTKQWQVNKFLYQFIGDTWQWHDKKSWTDQQWHDYAESDKLRTWIAREAGSIAGYFELHKEDGVVEICYFGLAEKFFGRGLGGHMLTRAIEEGWSWGAGKIIVDTCSRDHRSALANYQARGMGVYQTAVF